MKWLEYQRVRYTLSHYPIPLEVWSELIYKTDIFHGLSAVERVHLRELTTLFLHRKALSGVQGLTISTEMAVAVAAQACLPILKLGLDYYDGWHEVVLYPAAFWVERKHIDATGVVSHEKQALSGEAWSQGPVILAWDEIAIDNLAHPRSGRNVVIHELAHKLDMLNGSANGMPPLHPTMERQRWTDVLSQAFDTLTQDLAHRRHSAINPYAATAPAEFFAVVSEYFFTDPHTLHRHYPAVYNQLVLFYRQDPVSRWSKSVITLKEY